MSEITSYSPGSGERVQPRARIASTAAELDLSGTWKFHFAARPDLAPEGAAAVDFDDSDWDSIAVPSHWVLQGREEWGRPAYTNINYPFPVDPPFVPDENPTGDYRTTFELEEGFGERVHLRFDGVESLAIVSLNGVEVGVVRGSRLTQELDVTQEARPGVNVLHVRVHQWSAASYLEDQDQWWLPGIFRPVAVLARPAAGIDDVWLRADYDPASGHGRLLPELRCVDAAYPITVRVAELGVETTFASARDVAVIEVGEVSPWSADRPALYDAEVTNDAETRSLRVGFRRIEIVGHEWRVNGRKLRLRGVNRHDYDPDHGRVFDEDVVREQFRLMKRHNINALRTAHYPPHPRLLDLADEIGLWVIAENDLETHGFEMDGWVDNPTDDPRWRAALLDRIERFFERDKNHPSIIAWSLGNESWTGQNAAAMASWLRRRDLERPVHYEPDFEGRYTDVVSRMYPSLEEMEDLSAGLGHNRFGSPGRGAELAARPMILCEYAHAMGNGAGGLADYEELFDKLPQWHGGFVWEWRDHGLRTRTADGQEFFGYGGDFGEPLHDGSFVTDGMLLSDGTPSPMLAEYAAVITPIKLHVTAGEVWIENRRHDGDTADLRFVWRDELDGRQIGSGELKVDALAPGALAVVSLPGFGPRDGELWRTIEAVLVGDNGWAGEGHVVSRGQVLLADAPATLRPLVSADLPSEEDGVLTLGPGRFDARTGDLLSIGGHDVAGPRLELWRAPTENDRLDGFHSYSEEEPAIARHGVTDGPAWEKQWRAAGLDRLQRRVVAVRTAPGSLTVLHRYAPAATQQAVTVELVWTLDDHGLRLDASALPTAGWTGAWPRVGLHLTLPEGLQRAEWFGTGPAENYADSRAAAYVGRFDSAIEDLVVDYAVPQESGHRSDLRELTLPELGMSVSAEPVAGELPGFTLRAHDVHQVTAATHPHELPPSSGTHLYLDAQQQGLGGRSCGPDVRPEYQLRPRAAQWALRFHL
ncbi:glycoside hydrolase family 2 TIM barrel-domain containing protein [Tessaracoccus sp. Y36]